MSKLYWAKVKEDAIIPTKRDEDAGYDLYPCFEEDYLEIKPLHTRLVPLGVATAFDASYVMILKERGSTGTKESLNVLELLTQDIEANIWLQSQM